MKSTFSQTFELKSYDINRANEILFLKSKHYFENSRTSFEKIII